MQPVLRPEAPGITSEDDPTSPFTFCAERSLNVCRVACIKHREGRPVRHPARPPGATLDAER
jgi:hypothetical protein